MKNHQQHQDHGQDLHRTDLTVQQALSEPVRFRRPGTAGLRRRVSVIQGLIAAGRDAIS
jgi:hypothetical protein